MTEYRIRVDAGLMEKIRTLTKDTDIRTNAGRLRWIVNRLEHLQTERNDAITKKDLEAFKIEIEKSIEDLRRGY